jgi:dynein light intermediate chain
MTNIASGVKAYTESPTLLQYQPKKEIGDEDLPFLTQKKLQLPAIESNPSIQDALNAIFPPKIWEEDGKKYIQYVSQEPATREKARDLFKALDEKIKERQAREKGICAVREELYSQCFDEIIRQVTIECPERGLLLVKVRDEIKMTIASYQTLYESAILFGIRKQIQTEAGKGDLKKRLEDLENKKKELNKQKTQLDNKLKAFDKQMAERNQTETAKREEESSFLRQQNENLDKFLKSIDGTIKI